MVRPENIHTGSIVQTKQVIFRNIHLYIHVNVCNNNYLKRKEDMNLKEGEEHHMRELGEKKRKGDLLQLNYNLKKDSPVCTV